MGRSVVLVLPAFDGQPVDIRIGPQYRSETVFDLETMQPYSVKDLYAAFKKYTDYVVLYLPRTSDLRQIAELVAEGEKAQIVHYCADGRSKALCAYLGPFGKISV